LLGVAGWHGWFVWFVLLTFIGVDHPPVRDALLPLNGWRRLAAWLTIGAFFLTFMPEPIALSPPSPMFEGERTPVVWQAERPAVPAGTPARGIAL